MERPLITVIVSNIEHTTSWWHLDLENDTLDVTLKIPDAQPLNLDPLKLEIHAGVTCKRLKLIIEPLPPSRKHTKEPD